MLLGCGSIHKNSDASPNIAESCDPAIQKLINEAEANGTCVFIAHDSPIQPPSGCRFNPRCRYATSFCTTDEPSLTQHGSAGHLAACHHPLDTGPAAGSALATVPA